MRKEDGYEPRNDAIKVIGGLGNDRIARSIWAKMVGYGREHDGTLEEIIGWRVTK